MVTTVLHQRWGSLLLQFSWYFQPFTCWLFDRIRGRSDDQHRIADSQDCSVYFSRNLVDHFPVPTVLDRDYIAQASRCGFPIPIAVLARSISARKLHKYLFESDVWSLHDQQSDRRARGRGDCNADFTSGFLRACSLWIP